jgi:hypothetical protein
MKFVALSWLGLLVIFSWAMSPANSPLLDKRSTDIILVAQENGSFQSTHETLRYSAAGDERATDFLTHSSLSTRENGLRAYVEAKPTSAPARQVTPTALPAEYKVEQTHPAMITGAAILVFIIVVGVLAFSRRRMQ